MLRNGDLSTNFLRWKRSPKNVLQRIHNINFSFVLNMNFRFVQSCFCNILSFFQRNLFLLNILNNSLIFIIRGNVKLVNEAAFFSLIFQRSRMINVNVGRLGVVNASFSKFSFIPTHSSAYVSLGSVDLVRIIFFDLFLVALFTETGWIRSDPS